MSILIFDEEDVAESISFCITEKDFETSENSKDALSIINQKSIEMIILDAHEGCQQVLSKAKENGIPCYLYTSGEKDPKNSKNIPSIQDLQNKYSDVIQGIFFKPNGITSLLKILETPQINSEL